MHGFKPGAKRQKFADGGAVTDDKTKPASPDMLGTGAAANAGRLLAGRQAQIDKASDYANGGMVKGPGTGTSDDIEATVPEGSYVMPADSTKQIGGANLDAMGKGAPVDVNLSNGEQVMPPEQVHAVGVQTLNQMKDATHSAPGVDGGAGRGFAPKTQAPAQAGEFFFADGGVVSDEERKRRAQAQAGYDQNPSIRGAQAAADTTAQTNAVAGATAGYSGNAMARQMQANNDAGAQQRAVQTADRADKAQATIGRATNTAIQGATTPGAPISSGATPPQPAPAEQPGRVGLGAGFVGGGKAILGAATYPYAFAADKIRNGAAALVGGDAETLPGGSSKYSDAVGDYTARGWNQSVGAAETLRADARDMLGVQAAKPSVASPVAPTVKTPAPAASGPAATNSAPAQPGSAAASAPQGNGYAATGIPGIVGKKDANGQYSFTNEQAAVSGASGNLDMPGKSGTFSVIDGGAEGMQRNLRAAEILAGNNAIRSGQAEGGRGLAVIGTGNGGGDVARQRAINAASTPLAGAQRGQLTANQLRTLAGIQEGDQRDATTRYTNDQNNATALTTTGMREAGADQRFAQSNALDAQRTASEVEGRGFANRAAQRSEKLYQQYENAKTPAERSAVAEQIRAMSGKDPATPKDYMMSRKVPIFDAKNNLIGTQDEIVDLRTGQPIGGASAAQPPQNHIDALKKDPTQAAQFDAKYGAGASSRYIGAAN